MKKAMLAVAAVLGTAAMLVGFSPSANAQSACSACSNWVVSPDADAQAFGVTVVDGTAQVGAAYGTLQPQGIFGAGFTWSGGSNFSMTFDADLYTWDSYNAEHGYWDAFVVTVSTTGFYWDTAHTDPLPASSSMWV